MQVLAVSANRDERFFPDRDRLDLHRQTNPHVGFGHGIHYCFGAQLAKMELQVAVETLVRRFPGLRLAVACEEQCWRIGVLVRGLRALPVSRRPMSRAEGVSGVDGASPAGGVNAADGSGTADGTGPSGQWRVTVDADQCVGAGICAGTAPDHFRLVGGVSRPLRELAAPDDLLLAAEESCPVAAISVRDQATGAPVSPFGG